MNMDMSSLEKASAMAYSVLHIFDLIQEVLKTMTTLGTTELHWNFSSISKDAPDIHRFSNTKCVLTMGTTRNIRGIPGHQLETFQRSSAIPNI